MEEHIFIPAGGLELEAIWSAGDTARAGLVAHPHPLYGGSMHNNVVQAAVKALNQSGWAGLCFNFRGVGRSSGDYGQGLAEREDLVAAAAFLKEQGFERPLVIGYSFGAHVAAFAWERLKPLEVRPLVLIAPPAAFMSFDDLAGETEVGLIVCGQSDEIAPPDLAEALGRSLARPVAPVVIPGADHFFSGRETELIHILMEHLSS